MTNLVVWDSLPVRAVHDRYELKTDSTDLGDTLNAHNTAWMNECSCSASTCQQLQACISITSTTQLLSMVAQYSACLHYVCVGTDHRSYKCAMQVILARLCLRAA